MNILAFDTSTEKFSISILKNNKVVLNLSKILNKTYSKFLIPILKKSLEKSKLDIKEINYILISLGPGSFTGIRIGIAAAKGLGLPYKINISGFNNMDILANSINDNIKEKRIVTIIKSKKSDYYFQVFNSKKNYHLIRNDAKKFYEILKKAKVFFDDEIDLSNHINNIWHDHLSWWNTEKVQKSIKIFCDQYAYVNKNKLSDLKNILIK